MPYLPSFFYFFSLRQFVIVEFSSSLYYLYSAYILKIFKLVLEGIRARSKKPIEFLNFNLNYHMLMLMMLLL